MKPDNRYELRKVEMPRFGRFRTLYLVYVTRKPAGEVERTVPFCFLGMLQGWSRLWTFYPLTLSGKGDPAVTIDGNVFRPDEARLRGVRAGSKEEALEWLGAGQLDLDPEHFREAGELVSIARENNAKLRISLQRTLDNLCETADLYRRYVDELKWIDAKFTLTGFQREALRESADHWEAQIKTAKGAAKMAQTELDGIKEL